MSERKIMGDDLTFGDNRMNPDGTISIKDVELKKLRDAGIEVPDSVKEVKDDN